MNLTDLIAKLLPLGITGREAEVYIALLKNSALTATEISKITSVSLNKIYEVLQNLVKKKMCTENYLNGVKLFRCIEPKIAFQNIFSVFQEDINRKKALYRDELEECLMSLYNQEKNGKSPLDYIEVVSDRGQATDRFLTIQANAKSEILFFSKPPYVNSQSLGGNIDEIGNVCKKRVQVKSIYECGIMETREYKDNLLNIIEHYENLGEEARIIDALPVKLVIVDESISIFSLIDNVAFNPQLTTMIVHHPVFTMSQKTLFELYWDKSITIKDYKKEHYEQLNKVLAKN